MLRVQSWPPPKSASRLANIMRGRAFQDIASSKSQLHKRQALRSTSRSSTAGYSSATNINRNVSSFQVVITSSTVTCQIVEKTHNRRYLRDQSSIICPTPVNQLPLYLQLILEFWIEPQWGICKNPWVGPQWVECGIRLTPYL